MNDFYFRQFLNCVNCGGVLKDRVCPYCGTDYNKAKELKVKYSEQSYMATIDIDGKTYKAYLGDQEWHQLHTSAYRDHNGILQLSKPIIKRVWKFIEI